MPSTSSGRRADDLTARQDVIVHGEVALSVALADAGLKLDTVYRPGPIELIRGAVRAHAMELETAVSERRWRSVAGWLRRLPSRARHPEWNPAVALADVSLRRPNRLPGIKISTVRDDAYNLGTPRLLNALALRHPALLGHVEAYLERTDRTYGQRWSKTKAAPSRRLRFRC